MLGVCRQGSAGSDGLVSWEVWAALSEAIVCGTDHTFRIGDAKKPEAVIRASIWQRAKELQRAGKTKTAGVASCDGMHGLISSTGRRNVDRHRPHVNRSSPAGLHRVRRAKIRPNARDKAIGGGKDCCIVTEELTTRSEEGHHRVRDTTHREGIAGSSYRAGDFGAFSGAGFGSCDSDGGEYRDRSFPANEYHPENKHDLCVANARRNRSKGQVQNCCSTFPARRNSAPRTKGNGNGNIGRRRLNQSLATSRRRFFSKWFEKRLLRQKEAEISGRRPVSEPAASAPARTGTKGTTKTLTSPHRLSQARPVCDQKVLNKNAPKREETHHEGGGQRLEIWDTTTFAQQGWVGAWGAGIVADEGGGKFQWRGEETRRDVAAHQALLNGLETKRFRAETSSAKRKASHYQANMREAQVSL